jgi:hypothetical protein
MRNIIARRVLLAGPRLAWAAALLAAPDAMVRAAGGATDERSRRVARILGARHALQGMIELLSWPRWRRSGIAVDGLHATTAAGLALVDDSRRHVAVADTLAATVFAVLGAVAA